MKVDTDILQQVLQKHQLAPEIVRAIYDEVLQASAAPKQTRGKQPKKPFVLLVSDPKGVIPEGTELVGWAIQIDEEKAIHKLPESLQRIAQDFNASPKAQKVAASTLGDVFDTAAAKQFTEHGVYRKHKEAVFVVVTDNKIITDNGTDDA